MGRSFFGGTPPATARTALIARPQVVRAYWEGLRGPGGTLPARGDLDPRGMATALESVFIGDRIGLGLMRFRIAAAALADLCGTDMKGLPISTLFTTAARARLADLVEDTFCGRQAAMAELQAETGMGRPALAGRLLLLPVRRDDGAGHLILGCLATDGPAGRAPRRFDITHVQTDPLALAPARPAATGEPAPEEGPRLRLVHSTR